MAESTDPPAPLTGRMRSVVGNGATVATLELPTDYALGDWERAPDAERSSYRVKAWWAEDENIWYAEMQGADSLTYAGLAVGDTKEHALLDLLCLNAWHCDLIFRQMKEARSEPRSTPTDSGAAND